MSMEPGLPPAPAATSGVSRRLIGVNIALLAVLGVVTIAGVVSSRADAQPGAAQPGVIQPGRMRGEYTMVAGKIQGATTQAVYIIDASNQELVALSWDRSNNRFDPIGHRSLSDDAKYLTKPR